MSTHCEENKRKHDFGVASAAEEDLGLSLAM